jgi:hypothetical protein
MSEQERFSVIKGSATGHCCFTWSVVDKTKPVMDGGGRHMCIRGRFKYEAACECYEQEAAEEICAALNSRLTPMNRIKTLFLGCFGRSK